MSRAWEGYDEARRGRRRGKRWRIAVVVGFLAIAAVFAVSRCLPQGILERSGSSASGPNAGMPNPAEVAAVIYNENDPLSRDLADFYAGKRGIPPDRVVGIKCSIEEDISRQEYDDTIANPLRAIFDARGWWTRSPDAPGSEPTSNVTSNRIRYLVLMRGIPLRIQQTSGYPGDHCNEPAPFKDANGASVDSELTVLGIFTHSISGFLPNPYYRSFLHFGAARVPPGMMLAGRLDGPTGSMVRQVIESSLAVEKTGLWGRCYLDGRGMAPGSGPLAEGDEWIAKVDEETAPFILPTVYDNKPAMFSAAFPMTETALYLGWYSEQPAGPFAQGAFRFRPGAVACHIHSFSATSVRDPFKWWVGPLIDKGAAAVLGNVYEPYLSLTTHLDIFADRLMNGYTLVESAYAAQPGLSWMNTVVGDPLYRPGLVWKNAEFDIDDSGAAKAEPAIEVEGRAYLAGARTWRAKGAAAGAAELEKSGARLRSGTIYEGLGELEAAAKDYGRAKAAFEQAARWYKTPADEVRVAYEEALTLARAGKKAEAKAVASAARLKYAGDPSAAVLDEIKAEIAP